MFPFLDLRSLARARLAQASALELGWKEASCPWAHEPAIGFAPFRAVLCSDPAAFLEEEPVTQWLLFWIGSGQP